MQWVWGNCDGIGKTCQWFRKKKPLALKVTNINENVGVYIQAYFFIFD